MGQMGLSKLRPRKVPGPLFRRGAASVTRESCGWRDTFGLRRVCGGAYVVSPPNDTMAVVLTQPLFTGVLNRI
uniref:Uncharacterized protein n=1 Tax=Brassica oleracea var. oleracea TaxID=109376 RepID=A0A0D3BW51_BRAOL